MLTPLKALLLGLIQGLTEFLPISSSSHLKLAKSLLGVATTDQNQVLFDLICHLGTLCALLLFLRQDILNLFRRDKKKLTLLFTATLPLIPCYFLLKPLRTFSAQTPFLGFSLIVTAIILFAGHSLRFKRRAAPGLKKDLVDVLWIGTMQSAALIPGISRSASTISCARVIGWTPKDAVSFSFLLSIPTVFGGAFIEFFKSHGASSGALSLPLSVGIAAFFSSLVMGLIALSYAIKILERGKLKPFAWYCLVLGISVTIYFNFF